MSLEKEQKSESRDRLITFTGNTIQKVNQDLSDWLDIEPRQIKQINRHFIQGEKDIGYPAPMSGPNLMAGVPFTRTDMFVIDVIYIERG